MIFHNFFVIHNKAKSFCAFFLLCHPQSSLTRYIFGHILGQKAARGEKSLKEDSQTLTKESGNIVSDISGIIKKLHKKSFSKKISYTVFTDKAKARIDPAHAAPPTAFILIPKLPHRNQFLYPQVYCSCLLWSFAMFALPFLDLCEAFFETRLQALIRRLIILTICEGIRQTLHSGDFFLGIVCVLITLAVV